MTIPSIGYTIATALVSAVGKGEQFNSAREMSVWLGVTPTQHASGTTNICVLLAPRTNERPVINIDWPFLSTIIDRLRVCIFGSRVC